MENKIIRKRNDCRAYAFTKRIFQNQNIDIKKTLTISPFNPYIAKKISLSTLNIDFKCYHFKTSHQSICFDGSFW